MNMQQMMQQAKALQQKMQTMQTEMEKREFTGTAGGDLVKITSDGKGNVKKVFIDKSLLVEDEQEVLEDLIVAAFNNAKKQAEDGSNSAMKDLGIDPNMMKMPF